MMPFFVRFNVATLFIWKISIYDPEVPTIIWKQFLGSSVLEIDFQIPTILGKLIIRSQYFYEIVTECSFPSNLVLELLELQNSPWNRKNM